MGRVAELGCGYAAHTAAHRAAEHAETDRHTNAAPHLPGPETDLPGSANLRRPPRNPRRRRAIRTWICDPVCCSACCSCYPVVTRRAFRQKTEAAESLQFRGFPVGPAGFEPATP